MRGIWGVAANGAVWEETPCPLCGAADEDELLRTPGAAAGEMYRVARCRRCGLGYLNPRPDRASIGRFYPADYEPYRQGPKRGGGGRWAALRRRLERLVCARAFGDPPPPATRAEKVLATLAAPWLHPGRDSLTAIPFHGRGRLLDFGCGAGWFARRMRDRGWTVTAMDVNPRVAADVARRAGVRTLAGTLPHPEVTDAAFDVVVMGASLEHVHCPHEVVGAAQRALAPGGLLVVAVPNLDAEAFRWFGPDWWPLEPPRHLLHFTPATLRRLAAMHGLEVCEVRTLPRGSWMRLSLANRRRRVWGPAGRRGMAALSRTRLAAGVLTWLTSWAGQEDGLRLVARRPEEGRPAARAA